MSSLRGMAVAAHKVGTVDAIEAALRDVEQGALEMAAEACDRSACLCHHVIRELAKDQAKR